MGLHPLIGYTVGPGPHAQQLPASAGCDVVVTVLTKAVVLCVVLLGPAVSGP